MAENFDPQFFDFSEDVYLEENVDPYLEIDHENYQLQDPSEDPLKIPFCDDNQNEGNNCQENCVNKPRRSISVGNLICLNDNEEVEVKEIVKTAEDTLEPKKHTSKYSSSENLRKAGSNTSSNKNKASPTKLNTSREEKRSASRDNLNRLAQPNKYGSAQNLNGNNYVPMAEAVKEFHSATPKRFRTRPKLADGLMNKLGSAVPQSPALLTKNRRRPTPFNITSLKKQVTGSPKKGTFHFHAKPVPKPIYEPLKLKKAEKVGVTIPQTPTFMKRHTKEPIKPQDAQCSNTANLHDNLTKSNENISTQFKARPPAVLYKKPFEPKIEKRFIETTEFQLNTEIWAKQREKINELRREREEKIALAKQLEEESRLQKEEEEVAKLRKESVYKAQPIRKYKEIKIQPSGKVTEPKSPKFLTSRIRNKANKENEH